MKSHDEKIQCPACGSENLQLSTEMREVSVPFAKSVSIETSVYRCSACGESGDFAKENDAKYLVAQDAAQKQSVQEMLSQLNETGITMAYFERAMQLPTRTIARWKEGNFSASALALLRVVRTFPWILSVGETGFKEGPSKKILIQEAGKVVHQVITSSPNIESAFWCLLNDGKVEINARLTLATPLPAVAETNRYLPSGG